ncbi:MAG: polysaccharide biosynthesis C-terminal domain-containing protein [bacterium]|nr:polysaccharide biosynthesis C-terminal domain-containing protein [bacterium]
MGFGKIKFAWSLAVSVLALVKGFALLYLITANYAVEEVGKWFLFLALVAIVSALREGLIYVPMVKLGPQSESDDALIYLNGNWIVNLSFEIGVGLVVLVLNELGVFGIASELVLIYPIYGISLALYRWNTMYLKSIKSFKPLAGLEILHFIFIVGYFLFTSNTQILHLILGLSAMNALAFIVGAFYVPVRKLLAANISKTHFKQIWKYGSHGIMKDICIALTSRINIFITAAILGTTDTALLGLAQRYVMIVITLNNAVQLLLFPDLVKLYAQNNLAKIKELMEGSLSKLYAVLIPGVVIFTLAMFWLLVPLHGDAYQGAWPLIAIMLVTSLSIPLGTSFGSYVNAIGKPQLNSLIVFLSSIIYTGLSLIMIHTYGIWGAVIAPLVTEVIGLLIVNYIFKKHTDINLYRVLKLIPTQVLNLLKILKFKLL